MKSLIEARTIGLDAGRQAVAAAVNNATSIGVSVSVAVVDRAGHLVTYDRMDGAPLLTGQLAQDKAYTVAAFGLPTHAWWDMIRDEPSLLHGVIKTDRLIVYGGGLPITHDGELVGAIGVSGGTPEQDKTIAEAGARVFEERRSSMTGRLENKVAIVTGGGRGIGEAIAKRFAREGAKVVLAQRTEEEGKEVAKAITAEGGEATVISTDVTAPDSVKAMLQQTLSTYGKVDILVNNAGIGVLEDLVDLSMDNYDAVMDVNVRGVLLCMKYAARPMIEAGTGSIINMASFNAFVGLQRFALYCASKAAVVNLSRQTALDLGPRGIRVNAIAPGYIDNPMMHGYCDSHENPRATLAEALRSIPLGHFGTNDDVAAAALFLASDDAAFVTGTTLVVDGGTLCHGPHA
jgi:NAD(P)-dependent dehydrogenase (short-subunit alcohol dehydrogenase family)/uncharacterized protein GlcG (DUF336 family)